MSESFEKLKKKCLVSAIIKSLIIALSAGLFVAGIFILAFELSGKGLLWAYYLLIGVGVAGAAFTVCFLLMRPTDMKVAKKYDNEYGLNEKLQTMVAFSNVDSDIAKLQREDALEKLACIPAKRPQFKQIWYYFVIAVLALAMIFSAVFIPAAAQSIEPEPEPNPVGPIDGEDDTAFEYDLYMQSAIGELIMNVRESNLGSNEKDSIVAALEALDEYLPKVDTKSAKDNAVISTVTIIDGIIYNANTFRAISAKISEFDENLAEGIKQSIAVYNTSSTPLTEYVRVKAFETRLGDLIEIALEEPLDKSSAPLKVPQSGKEDEETGEIITLDGVLTSYIDNLAAALEELDEADAICVTLEEFIKALNIPAGKLGKNYKDQTLFDDIDSAYKKLNLELNSALEPQCYNCVMNLFIRNKLSAIFGLKTADLPVINEDIASNGNGTGNGNGPGDGEGDDNPGGTGGGNGKYDFVFGSDDIIYDPDRADYVSFGEVLDEYYAKMQNRIIAGDVPEDLSKILQIYFEILYNGIKDNSAEE